MSLCVVPLTLRAARAYVNEHHRHHRAPQGGLFAIGLVDLARPDDIVGCVIVGKPVARGLNDGYTAEVTRLTTDGSKNACSMLYAAAWRAARAMGYRRLVTYILTSEPGTSLVAAGFVRTTVVKGRSWTCPSRPREDKHPTVDKTRWEIAA